VNDQPAEDRDAYHFAPLANELGGRDREEDDAQRRQRGQQAHQEAGAALAGDEDGEVGQDAAGQDALGGRIQEEIADIAFLLRPLRVEAGLARQQALQGATPTDARLRLALGIDFLPSIRRARPL
jgi:hypothetical protein